MLKDTLGILHQKGKEKNKNISSVKKHFFKIF